MVFSKTEIPFIWYLVKLKSYLRKTPGGVLVGGRVKSDETLGTDVVVRSLY